MFRDGAPAYELALVVPSSQFQDLLAAQDLPSGWLSGVVDGDGDFVARIPAGPSSRASRQARNSAWRRRRASNVIVSHQSIEGVRILSAYAPLPNGWTAGVAAASDRFAVGPSAFLLMLILAGVALAASLILSFLSSRRLAQQMGELQAKAAKVVAGSFRRPDAYRRSRIRRAGAGDGAGFAPVGRARGSPSAAPRRICERAKSTFASWPTVCRNWFGRRGPMGASTTPTSDANAMARARTERSGLGGPDSSRGSPRDGGDLVAGERGGRALPDGAPADDGRRRDTFGTSVAPFPLLNSMGEVVRWYGTTTDIHDQKLREENVTFLMTEVNHRSRNLLAVALAIARRTATSVADASRVREEILRSAAWADRQPGFADRAELAGVPIDALVLAQATRRRRARGPFFDSMGRRFF